MIRIFLYIKNSIVVTTRLEINHKITINGSAITLAAKRNKPVPVFDFQQLDKNMSLEDSEKLLISIIYEWDKLTKRFSLQGFDDHETIARCQHFTKKIIEKFPQLEYKYLYFHYDEALDDFLGVKYVPRRDKKAQEILGYRSVIFDGKSLYLFPIE